ncbi:MAG: CvpA family protein [Anaerovoracaceae bacterium]
MWLDIITALIFVLSTAQGSRSGFMRTLFHAAGWIASLVLAFLTYPFAASFLKERTPAYAGIYDRVLAKLTDDSQITGEQMMEGFPSIMGDMVNSIKTSITTTLATGLSTILFSIVVFMGIAILIRISFLIFSAWARGKKKKGFTGFADGLLGMIIGAVRGILLIFIFLSLLIPLSNLSSGTAIANALEISLFTGTLYDNNLLLLIIKDLF